MQGVASLLTRIKRQSKLAAVLIAGLLIGGLGSAVVFASIPDNDGMIHACYRTSGLLANGQVRIIDSASETCNGNETEISWDQGGPKIGDSLSNFSGLNLIRASLQNRYFVNVDFSGTNLRLADLSESNLQGASFSNTVLSNTNMINTNLQDADFSNASGTIRVSFSGSDLQNANLMNTDIGNSDFTNTDLDGTNLTGSTISSSTFEGSDMSSSILTGITWSNVTCPDGTNSDNNNGNTCIGHLVP